MDQDRLRCAGMALHAVPEAYRTVDAADVAAQDHGHSFHHGMHLGWAWGQDERGRIYLDFLSEHRHPGMHAERYFADGRSEPIPTPAEMRAVFVGSGRGCCRPARVLREQPGGLRGPAGAWPAAADR